MDSSDGIEKIDLSQEYKSEIFGLGEVYEIMSVENIRKKLLKKFRSGTLYLASNKGHIQRGMTLDDLENQLSGSGFVILEKGYADSPPWQSKPRGKNNRRNYPSLIISISKMIFFFLVRLEAIREGSENSHMIFCLVNK
jgi:hypothetical protein